MSENNIKTYDLDKLLHPFDFFIFPEDDIKEVKIGMIRLRPYNGECDIIMKVPGKSGRNLYDIAGQWINPDSPIIDNFVVQEVRIDIRLNNNQRSSVIVKSSYKKPIDYKSPLESLIHHKYLKHWGLSS